MYEIKEMLTLSYNDNNVEIQIPLNFEELKNIFYKKFNANPSKSFKFIYFIENEFHFISEYNFSEKIKNIPNLQNDRLVLVIDDNDENQNNQQFNNLDNNTNKQKENDIYNEYLKQKSNLSLRKLGANSNEANKI